MAAQVAIIERSRTRHIINLKDLLKRCNAMKLDGAFAAASEGGAAAGGGNRGAAKLGRTAAGAVTCVALSFDDVEDFEGMLTELQTVDVLVRPVLLLPTHSPGCIRFRHRLNNAVFLMYISRLS